jgi:hypothetical protein
MSSGRGLFAKSAAAMAAVKEMDPGNLADGVREPGK